MSQVLDTCPNCQQRNLIAVCRTTVEYSVTSESGGQSWDRLNVDDDDSTPTSFRCGNCGAEFSEFGLDEQGYLVRLGSPTHTDTPPEDSMSAEQFRDWLTNAVGDWCRRNGLPPNGEGCDLGDLYRHLEDTEAYAAIGVTLVPAYEAQTLYLVGPDAAWLATTGIELGIESETVWHDPLSNLRLGVPMADLMRHGERLRRRADEVAALLATATAA